MNVGQSVTVKMTMPDGKGNQVEKQVPGKVIAVSRITEEQAERAAARGKSETVGRIWKLDIEIPDEIRGRGKRVIYVNELADVTAI